MVCTTSFNLEDRNTLQAFRKNFVNILSTFQFQESTLKRLSFYNNHHPEKGCHACPMEIESSLDYFYNTCVTMIATAT